MKPRSDWTDWLAFGLVARLIVALLRALKDALRGAR